MSAALSVTLQGTTFFVRFPSAESDAGAQACGLFHDDVRHLSRWQLSVDDRPLVPEPGESQCGPTTTVTTVPTGPSAEASPPVTVLRQQMIAGGLVERVRVANHQQTTDTFRLRVEVDADFASLLWLHGVQPSDGSEGVPVSTSVSRSVAGSALVLSAGRGLTSRSTSVTCDRDARIDPRGLTIELTVPARGHADVVLQAQPSVGPGPAAPAGTADFHVAWGAARGEIDDWLARHPVPQTPWPDLTTACRAGIADLAALRLASPLAPGGATVAAGVPWYVALFGRDALLASYFALPFARDLAVGTLRALAETQATGYDDGADAEPGKIVHEVRAVAGLGEPPAHRYYGAVDATPLFLVLLADYVAWTGDTGLAHELEPAARAALAWLDDPRVVRDGWVVYERRSRGGLVNQCWKDSPTSIRFADGRAAEPPIAACEVQGYVFDALVRTADLAEDVWRDPSLARRLRQRADRMRDRFEATFWLPDRECYALARDGQGRLVDALTSNIGHLLWSGIVSVERAGALAAHLVSAPLFTGWGVRTMAAGELAYDPLDYHCGAVWPHDTALAAAGLFRYGYRREGRLLAEALVRAAAAFDHRLPEVFAGLSADEVDGPVEYSDSCRPQAWAAATPLLLARLLLELEPPARTDPPTLGQF